MGLAAVVYQQVLHPVAEQRRQSLHQGDHITGVGDVRPPRGTGRELTVAVLWWRQETVEDKVADSEWAPKRYQGQIPFRMRAGCLISNNRTERMTHQHCGAGADHSIHTRLDLLPD